MLVGVVMIVSRKCGLVRIGEVFGRLLKFSFGVC